MFTTRVPGSGAPIQGCSMPHDAELLIGVAAAAHAELAADGRQREHRHRRAAAVAVALEPPAAADQRRAALGVQRRDARDRRGVHAAHLRGARERPGLRPLAQAVGVPCVVAQERLVRAAAREQVAMQREGERHVRARTHGQMDVGAARQRRRARIDDDEGGAALLGLAHERHEVNAGRRRVHAPEHDQRGVHVVLIGDRRHLAVEGGGGRAGGRRAQRAREPRGAVAAPEPRVEVVLRQQPVRSAVRDRQDGGGAVPGLRPLEPVHDLLEGLVPRDAREPAFALASAGARRGRAAGRGCRRARRTAALSRR